MTIFIEGLAFPLGELNVNGWGIPFAEADNAIKSLKASVLKICPGESHACDFSEDPYGRIGRVVDAWQQDNGIYVKATVTDSIASRKIEEGTWDEHTWSVFGDSEIDPKLNDGWAKGFTVKSLTLVKQPAWIEAHYNVAASAEGKFKLHTISQFQIIASKTGDGNTPDELKIEDLQKQIDVLTKLVDELKPKAESAEGLTTQVAELTASKTTLEKELGEKTKLVASLELEKAGSVPIQKVKEEIAAAIEKHDIEEEAKLTLAAARERFVAARKVRGQETKPEEFSSLSASDFDAMTAVLSASGEPPRLVSNNSGITDKVATGAYNPKTGAWE